MSLLLVPPPQELVRPSRFYQGCGTVLKGSRLDRIAFLNRVETSPATTLGLSHIIEAKNDGIWVALVSNSNGDVWILTKTGTHKTPDDMPGIKLLPDTIVVGELAGGSQQSLKDIEKYGCRFVRIFDVLKVSGNDVTCLTLLKRKALLKALTGKLSEKGGRWAAGLKHIPIMPMWSSGLVEKYNAEPEGLIAKEISDGPYVCGSRNGAWIKLKKRFSAEYVITGWTKSTAATKIDRSIHGMAESVTVAGWIMSTEVTVKDNIRGITEINGVPCTLVDLMDVGAMSDDMALSVAANFSYWMGKVIVVSGYSLFKSGAMRHPSIEADEDGMARIGECHHTSCIYRLNDAAKMCVEV